MLQYQDTNREIRLLRSKLIFLYLLNVTDFLFTRLLISTGLFYEANIIMAPIIEDITGMLLKIGLTAILLAWIYYRVKAARPEQMRYVRWLVNGGLGLYVLINITHVVGLVLFLTLL